MKLPAIITDENPSSEMACLLETPMSPVYGTDANPGGFEMRETLWTAPVEVSRATKSEAERLLVHAETAALPAGRDIVERWISSLGTLQAGKGSEADAKVKTNSYTAMFDYPAACFTKATLDEIARKSSLREYASKFPEYGWLAERLDEYAVPIRNMVERLRRIAEAPEALPKPSDPELEKRHEELRVKSEKLRHDSNQEILQRSYKSAGIKAPAGELTIAQFDADMAANENG